jgi:hypothetical protein
MSKNITPVFVVGCHRCGTTWLANIISRHSNVASMQTDKHRGINESAFFSHVYNHYGDFSRISDYIEFVEAYSSYDLFRLSGLEKSFFYEKKPTTYHEFFKMMMDRYAISKECNLWLEKTPAHALYIGDISKKFPKSKIFSIKRGVLDATKSSIKKKGYKSRSEKIYNIIRYVIHYKRYYNVIDYYRANGANVTNIKYEDLVNKKEGVIMRVCDVLGVPFEEGMVNQKYRRNSSFQSVEERETLLDSVDEGVIRMVGRALDAVPSWTVRWLSDLYERNREYDIPEWFFSHVRDEHGLTRSVNDPTS